jgi:uncharacterized membrane protein YcfT
MFLIAKENASVTHLDKAASSDRISWVYHARGIAIMLIVYRHIVLGMQAGGVAVSEVMYNLQIIFSISACRHFSSFPACSLHAA